MGTTTIDKHIPLPARTSKYPLFQMEVGDSFFVAAKTNKHKLQVAVCLAAIRCRDRTGWRFKTQQVDGGIRCWRTE